MEQSFGDSNWDEFLEHDRWYIFFRWRKKTRLGDDGRKRISHNGHAQIVSQGVQENRRSTGTSLAIYPGDNIFLNH